MRTTAMNYLDAVLWFLIKLGEDQPFAWTFFVLGVLAVGIALVRDLRAHKSTDESA
jgi:uncharacterized membrane protein (DUF106 family)